MRPIVITRPQPEAGLWAQQLQAHGLHTICLPMMAIGPSTRPEAQANIQAALDQLQRYTAIMFVSGNAVRYFWQHLNERNVRVPLTTRLWAPGPGTAQALISEGALAQQIDQPPAHALQFDSEALWGQIEHQTHQNAHILIVRGSSPEPQNPATGHGRQWLSEQLTARGAQLDFAPVYERCAPPTTSALIQAIEQLQNQSALWLFSSSECLHNLVTYVSKKSWGEHIALATHPRIAQQARKHGFGCVIETKPTVQSVAGSIKSLHDL